MSERLWEMTQAILTGYDTTLARQWRLEDRNWREQDLDWRKNEKDFMSEQKRWHGVDVEQRQLDNARFIWNRFVEKNRRDVEERSEQLQSITNLSALIAGFAVVSFLEFSYDVEGTPKALTMLFGFTTSATVGLMSMSMVGCSLMHASILKSGKQYVAEDAEWEFISRCRDFVKNYQIGDRPPVPRRSFSQHWNRRCENDWRIAFRLFSAGILFFLLNLVFAAWIRFSDSIETAIIVTVVLFFAICFFVYVHRIWANHLLGREAGPYAIQQEQDQRQPLCLPWDWHAFPGNR